MPAVISRRGGKWVVLSHRGGQVLGTHPSREKALAQQRAVNASLHREGKI